MSLTKQDKAEIQKYFKDAVTFGKSNTKDKYKQTEKRLYAYPILVKNIDRYYLDIEDIKKEDLKRSHDIVFFGTGGTSSTADLEDLRESKILIIQQKIIRDKNELKEIDAALKLIADDEYYKIIELNYFKNMPHDDIATTLNCDRATVFRNKKRLINIISISFYGANAL